MRHAPAVTVDLPVGLAWRLVHAGLAGAASATAAAAGLLRLSVSGAVLGASLACTAAAAAFVAWRWSPFVQGRLRWDGQQWWFLPEKARHELSGRLRVMIDLGDRMLLRFDPDPSCPTPATLWLPCGRLPGAQAVLLRAAVYCRALNPDHLPRRGRETR